MKDFSITGFKSSLDVLEKLKRDQHNLYKMIVKQNSIGINDSFINFYTYAYHIKDWLKLENFNDVEDYINSKIELSICADLCNLTKHKKLNRNPRLVDPLYEIYQSGFRASSVAFDASSEIPIDATTYNVKLESGNEYEILYLVKEIIRLWETFIFK